MVAPIDAKTVIEVDGEKITLRLNMRTIGLAEKAGIDMFDPFSMDRQTTLSMARLVKALATPDHEDQFTDEQWLAITLRGGADIVAGLATLFDAVKRTGGDENPPEADKAKQTA